MKPVDYSEECRARIVRHMTADDDLSQRVQIAQQRIVETAPSEAKAGERDSLPEACHERKSDSRNELKNKHQRVL